MNRFGIVSIFTITALLMGCGGGGGSSTEDDTTLSYKGVTEPVEITTDNAEVLAESSVEAANQAVQAYISDEAIPLAVVITDTSDPDLRSKVNDISLTILKNSPVGELPAGVVYTAEELNGEGTYYFCGGSVSVSDSIVESDTQGTGTVTYNNLCITDFDGYGNDAYLNGSLAIWWGPGYEKVIYTNLSVTVNGEVIADISGEMSCSWDAETETYDNLVCTSASYYEGSDGQVYKIADATVSGSDDFGWYVDATFYHPDHGYVTLTASGIKYECENGRPSAGQIQLTNSVDSSWVWMEFTDCETYQGGYQLADGTTGLLSGW